jgi:putative phosphoribosyl transferase
LDELADGWQDRDSASEAEIRDVEFGHRGAIRQRILQIERALERIKSDTYGRCVRFNPRPVLNISAIDNPFGMPLIAERGDMEKPLKDRAEAGRLLAEKLTAYANREDVIVLGLPRGGVPVAFEIAKRLKAPLDVFVVRKLGVPWQEELAMGAIATGGVRVLNDDVVKAYAISEEEITSVEAKEQKELERRERAYRGDRPALDVRGRTVLLVDNGIATGTTMRAGLAALRKLQPARIVVAVAVAPQSTYEELKAEADEVVCILTPEAFFAISMWYERFAQTTDEEVRDLLARAVQQKTAAVSTPTR